MFYFLFIFRPILKQDQSRLVAQQTLPLLNKIEKMSDDWYKSNCLIISSPNNMFLNEVRLHSS